MTSRKLAILLGHSHTGSLIQAITTRAVEDRPDRGDLHVAMFKMYQYDGQPPYLAADPAGGDRFNPFVLDGAARFVADLGPPTYLVSFGGNDWAVLAMMKHRKPFDFIMPGAEDLPLDAEAELVPLHYIKAILASLVDRYLYQLFQLRKATDAPILLYLPPPPIGDNAFISEKMDDFFRKHADFSGIVGTKFLRRKMWLLQNAMYRKVCAENDVTVIEAPAAAVDPEGYLATAFYGQDATHANPAYGDLMLRQAEGLIGGTLRSWYWFPD